MNISTKRVQIDKAKTVVVGSVAAASFIVIFSLVASKALLSQRSYQSRVIKGQETAVKQLKDNIKASTQLVASYQQFVNQPTNVLGGNPAGQGDKDGDNAKIILDALPSKYDFPAVATSLEKLITGQNLKITSISGTDDEVAQSATDSSSSTDGSANNTPNPVEIPFQVSVEGTYDAVQGLTNTLYSSIRPFNIKTLSFSGKNNDLRVDITASTYYLPEKQLTFPTQEVQ